MELPVETGRAAAWMAVTQPQWINEFGEVHHDIRDDPDPGERHDKHDCTKFGCDDEET